MRGFELDVLVVTADIGSPWYADARLAGRGFAVRLTGDACVAARSAADHPPDVAVVDLGTPGVDAARLVRSLRGQPRNGNPPLVLVAVEAAGSDELDGPPTPDGVDMLLGRDGPGAGGAVVGALNRLRGFLADLRTHGSGPRGPAAARGSVAARLDRTAVADRQTPPALGRAVQQVAAPATRGCGVGASRGAVQCLGSENYL